MTVLDLVKQALGYSNVIALGEAPDSATLQDAIVSLNMLLASWENDGLVAVEEWQSFAVSQGVSEYTIGDSETWDGNKPTSIKAAYLTDSFGNDIMLNVISSIEYSRASDKDSQSVPCSIMYMDGAVTLYKIPEKSYTITILSNKPFTVYHNGSDQVILPNGYNIAIVYNLSAELSQKNFGQVSAYLDRRATETLEVVKRTNLKSSPIMVHKRNGLSRKTFNPESGT